MALLHARDRQSLVVQATYSDGVTRDITAEAKFTFANPALVKMNDGLITPAADGSTELKIEFEGKSLTVPVSVKDAAKERPISFKNDVMPVFMRVGCNTGSCHGAARGKDGFRLSLFGFDPDGDHHRITREMAGRRINLALPEESLMIAQEHERGERTPAASSSRKATRNTRRSSAGSTAGAPNDPADVTKPVVDGNPAEAGRARRRRRHAAHDRAREVFRRHRCAMSRASAFSSSNNDTSAKIDRNGLVTAGQRGEAFVMARFATFTVGSQVIVIPKDVPYAWPNVPENNYVDTLVFNKHKKLRITPSELCSDEVFLRRAFLDIVGVLPTREEYRPLRRRRRCRRSARSSSTSCSGARSSSRCG